MNQAFVTLLSSIDYIPAICSLNANLIEVESKFPLYVMVTENIYDEAIKYLLLEDIKYIKVPVVYYSKLTRDNTKDPRLLSIASKMNIFTLHQFDKVVYLDADCVILDNIDDLFDYPDGAMYDEGGATTGFVGLFVCTPSAHALKYYMLILQHESSNMWESDLLEPLWFPFKTNPDYRIPPNYFVNINRDDFDNVALDAPIKVVHFCNKAKPWNYTTPEDFFSAIREYKDLNSSQLRYDIIEFYINHYILPLKNQYPELFH